MNCQDFESRMDALARGTLADTRTRVEASAHAEACARCAARLADERALTGGLRALQSKSKAAEAPACVESALLAALRACAASGAVAGGVVRAEGAGGARVVSTRVEGRVGVSPPAGRSLAHRWSWAKTVAVAALAAAAALTFFMLIPPGMSLPAPGKAGEVAGTPARQENVAHTGTGQRAAEPGALTNSTTDDGPSPTVMPDAAGRVENRIQRAPIVARTGNGAHAVEAKFGTGGERAGSQAGRGVAEDAGAEEIATDFIPLMQGGRLTQGEGGHLVRVELPRSALASFGLPLNAEAAGGRVKADVLLGEDGLARAIRFVR